MRTDSHISCRTFPCVEVRKESYSIPGIDLDPNKIKAVMISEAAPQNPSDYYYRNGSPLFNETTIQAFKDANLKVNNIEELLDLGFYYTSAIKCGKIGYGIETNTVKSCSKILETELELFPNLKVLLLMGDVAIRALNDIAKRKIGKKVIPSGSTYKIRSGKYYYGNIRVFPSYLQAGPSFFIEKSKRRMIAEDISEALKILKA